jgi:hypothetical protein
MHEQIEFVQRPVFGCQKPPPEHDGEFPERTREIIAQEQGQQDDESIESLDLSYRHQQ